MPMASSTPNAPQNASRTRERTTPGHRSGDRPERVPRGRGQSPKAHGTLFEGLFFFPVPCIMASPSSQPLLPLAIVFCVLAAVRRVWKAIESQLCRFGCFSPGSTRSSAVLAGLTVCAHVGLHDNTLVLANGSHVLSVVHLEHIYETRGFHMSARPEEAETQWLHAWEVAVNATDLPLDGLLPTPIHALGLTSIMEPTPQKIQPLLTALKPDRQHTCQHQHSHATVGFYDSPFATALVLSYDGGGGVGSSTSIRQTGTPTPFGCCRRPTCASRARSTACRWWSRTSLSRWIAGAGHASPTLAVR